MNNLQKIKSWTPTVLRFILSIVLIILLWNWHTNGMEESFESGTQWGRIVLMDSLNAAAMDELDETFERMTLKLDSIKARDARIYGIYPPE